MDKDLLLVVKDDTLGRMIQDLNLKVRKRAQRRWFELYNKKYAKISKKSIQKKL